MKLVPFEDRYQEEWDSFICEESWNGTFLHTQKYLSYHGDRFKDRSLVVQNEHGRTTAVFPAAEQMDANSSIMSHPGITYGGLVAGPHLRGENLIECLHQICLYYRDLGYSRILYKAVPYIYHRQPFQDDLYALFRIGAKAYRYDISACIDLHNRGEVSKGHKYSLKKATKSGIAVKFGREYAKPIMEIITIRLMEKFAAVPVHTLEEILSLKQLFQENILFAAAVDQGQVVAGAIIFITTSTFHTQYLITSQEGQQKSALNLLLETCIVMAQDQGKRYFDFGTSNENDGQILNQGLFEYKINFGSGSVVHAYYEIDLWNLK